MKEDLSNTWNISIAVKIAVPILWIIILASIIFSIFAGQDAKETLELNTAHDANVLAHEVTELIKHSGTPEYSRHFSHIEALLKNLNFHSVEFRTGEALVTIGQMLEGDEYINHSIQTNSGMTEITIYHTPFSKQIEGERRKTLFTAGPVFIAFGLILAWLIRFVVIRPLLELVDATQKISEGNMDYRVSINREDEFGTLARFFNQMMDNVNDNNKQLLITAEKAKQASRAKSTFLANMSHELRTPLNAIIGYTQMLREDAKQAENEQAYKDLNNIHKSGEHLLSLINDILDISKIEAGITELNIEEQPLDLLISDVELVCQPLADEKNNTFSVNTPDTKNINLNLDITKVRQILLNLISNACKFTENGSITLDIEIDNNWITFNVIDTGIGISQDHLKKIFNPFQQADDSTTRKFGGSGLGLAISRHFCEKMNGQLSVETEIGKGTVFKLRLPLNYNQSQQPGN